MEEIQQLLGRPIKGMCMFGIIEMRPEEQFYQEIRFLLLNQFGG